MADRISTSFLEARNIKSKDLGDGTFALATYDYAVSNGELSTTATLLDSAAHIGIIGLDAKEISITPTVSTSLSAYLPNDSIGGKFEFANALRTSSGTVVIKSATIVDKANVKPVGTLILFRDNPATAILTDTSPVVLSTDTSKISGIISFPESVYNTINTVAIATVQDEIIIQGVGVGTSIYGAFCVQSTPEFSNASDFSVILGVVR